LPTALAPNEWRGVKTDLRTISPGALILVRLGLISQRNARPDWAGLEGFGSAFRGASAGRNLPDSGLSLPRLPASTAAGSYRRLPSRVPQRNAECDRLLAQRSYRTLHLLCDLGHRCPRFGVRSEFFDVVPCVFATCNSLRFLCH
jgi:hypothetical protein